MKIDLYVADVIELLASGKLVAMGLFPDRKIVLNVPHDAPDPSDEMPYGVNLTLCITISNLEPGIPRRDEQSPVVVPVRPDRFGQLRRALCLNDAIGGTPTLDASLPIQPLIRERQPVRVCPLRRRTRLRQYHRASLVPHIVGAAFRAALIFNPAPSLLDSVLRGFGRPQRQTIASSEWGRVARLRLPDSHVRLVPRLGPRLDKMVAPRPRSTLTPRRKSEQPRGPAHRGVGLETGLSQELS